MFENLKNCLFFQVFWCLSIKQQVLLVSAIVHQLRHYHNDLPERWVNFLSFGLIVRMRVDLRRNFAVIRDCVSKTSTVVTIRVAKFFFVFRVLVVRACKIIDRVCRNVLGCTEPIISRQKWPISLGLPAPGHCDKINYHRVKFSQEIKKLDRRVISVI